jgi:hypothetical protein
MTKPPHLADTQGLFDGLAPLVSKDAPAPAVPGAVPGAEGHRARMRCG